MHAECLRVSVYAPYVVVNRTALHLFVRQASRFSLPGRASDDMAIAGVSLPPARIPAALDTGEPGDAETEVPLAAVDDPLGDAIGLAYLWFDKPDMFSARAQLRTADSLWGAVSLSDFRGSCDHAGWLTPLGPRAATDGSGDQLRRDCNRGGSLALDARPPQVVPAGCRGACIPRPPNDACPTLTMLTVKCLHIGMN